MAAAILTDRRRVSTRAVARAHPCSVSALCKRLCMGDGVRTSLSDSDRPLRLVTRVFQLQDWRAASVDSRAKNWGAYSTLSCQWHSNALGM